MLFGERLENSASNFWTPSQLNMKDATRSGRYKERSPRLERKPACAKAEPSAPSSSSPFAPEGDIPSDGRMMAADYIASMGWAKPQRRFHCHDDGFSR